MNPISTDHESMKKIIKESLTETLYENRELFQEIFTEIFEDIALGEAIEQGRQTKAVTREEIFKTLEQDQ